MLQLLHVSECCFAPAYFLNSEYIHNASYEAWAKTKKQQHSNYNYNYNNYNNNNNNTYITASLKSASRASKKGLSNPGGNLNK